MDRPAQRKQEVVEGKVTHILTKGYSTSRQRRSCRSRRRWHLGTGFGGAAPGGAGAGDAAAPDVGGDSHPYAWPWGAPGPGAKAMTCWDTARVSLSFTSNYSMF